MMMMLGVAGVLVLVTGVLAFTLEDAATYLRNFGYLKEVSNYNVIGKDEEKDALRDFQDFYELGGNGELTDATIALMSQPRRCGNPDRNNSYVLANDKWRGNKIAWDFISATVDDIRVAEKCFADWSKHTNLQFRRNRDKPNITITYVLKKHRNFYRCMGGLCRSEVGNSELGHAYFPQKDCTEIHLSSAEKWGKKLMNNTPGTTALYQVLLHEIGHSLGLAHSSNRKSVMYPWYSADVSLNEDDISGIQALYGVPVTTTSTTTKTTTPRHPRQTTTHRSRTTTTTVPNLCLVKNKFQRLLVLNKHLYMFYKEWVWIISLNDKKINPPIRISDYLPIQVNFEKDGYIYQRPTTDELILFQGRYLYLINPTSFVVQNRLELINLGIPSNAKLNGAVTTYTGKTYIFYDNLYCAEIDDSRLAVKSRRFINEVFPGVPTPIDHVFRYIDGVLYFFKGEMVYKFNEFLGKMIQSQPIHMEEILNIPCQSEGLLQQLRNLLSLIIANKIITSGE